MSEKNSKEIIYPADNILHYGSMFKKVCDVQISYSQQWEYKNIVKDIMYSTHRSWVYCIVVNGIIEKIGETGNFLGIEMSDGQPKKGTECRFGRLRNGDGTDYDIRMALNPLIKSGYKVELYAYQCPETVTKQKIVNETKEVKSQIHKAMELELLDYFYKHKELYPSLNKGRK